jgi:hypothetical protein
MLMKQLQLNYYSLNNSHLLELGNRIFISQDLNNKYIKFLQKLVFNLKETYLKLFSNVLKSFKAQF